LIIDKSKCEFSEGGTLDVVVAKLIEKTVRIGEKKRWW